MSEPILLALAFWPALLLLLAIGTRILPATTIPLASALLSGIACVLCLFTSTVALQPSNVVLPIGPPGLSLHIALDALSAFFLVIVLTSATVLSALAAAFTEHKPSFRIPLCIAGIMLTLLAADAVLLAIGLAIACGAVWIGQNRRRTSIMLVPFAVLAAVALLTPSGFAPQFDAIRTAPATLMNPSASALLTIGAVTGLITVIAVGHSQTRDGLAVGLVLPAALYLLLRLVVELPSGGGETFWGILLMAVGSTVAVWFGWYAASARDIDTIVASLARCHAGLGLVGAGILITSRLSDLPNASGDALAGMLLIAAGNIAATVSVVTVHAVAEEAGTFRLSRLGGLIHLMPGGSGALGGALLSMAALPPGLGFACVWLLLRAIVSAPRTGGLIFHLITAASAAAIGLAAVLATTACLRLAGVAILGRPRSPQAAGARDASRTGRATLLALTGLVTVMGLLPGNTIDLLAGPVMRDFTGLQAVARAGPFGTGPGYLALPVAALVGFFAAAVTLIRRQRRGARVATAWNDGAVAPPGLPFGDPLAQISGKGFLPRLPSLPRLQPPRTRHRLPRWRLSPSQTGFWVLLAAAASVLIILALGSLTG